MPFIRKTDLERLILAGDLLSNIAYNMGRHEGEVLQAADCRGMGRCVGDWDEARAVVRKATRAAKEEPTK